MAVPTFRMTNRIPRARLLALGKLRRFAIWYLLARQDYFELIPSRSNNLQPVRGLLGCAPRALSGSDRLFHMP